MYIEHVPNRNSPPAVLLRESYRDGNTVKKRTLANLSSLPAEVIEGLKVLLRGGVAVSSVEEAFVIERSLPHGHVAAVLGAARACGAEQWFAPAPLRSVVMALLVARVVSPASKLATHRMLCEQTATHSLSRLLGLGKSNSSRSMPRSTGWAKRRKASRSALPGSIWAAVRWCSTTSPPRG